MPFVPSGPNWMPVVKAPKPQVPFFIDSSTTYVGIGTTTPQAPLDVSGVLMVANLTAGGVPIPVGASRLSIDEADAPEISMNTALTVLSNSGQSYSLASDAEVPVGFEKILFNVDTTDATVNLMNPSGTVARVIPAGTEARLIWLGVERNGWV